MNPTLPLHPLERVDQLHHEADYIIRELRLYDVLSPYGRVVLSGSYFLDVMVYPDIDLYITKVSIKQLFEIGAQLADSKLVFQLVFKKSDDATLPDGLYLKAQIAYGNWGRPWKIDIWSLADEIIRLKMEEMLHFKGKMTTSIRKQIVDYKLSVMTDTYRTPMYSGYFIYKAFIDEGFTDFQDVTRYLLDHGIILR